MGYVRRGTYDTHNIAMFCLYLHLCFVSSWNVVCEETELALNCLCFLLFWCSLFLDYCFPEALCWTSGWKRKEKSNYLPVHFLFFSTFSYSSSNTSKTSVEHNRVGLSQLVCVFWRNTLIWHQIIRSEQIWSKLPYLAFKIIASLLITVMPSWTMHAHSS